MEAAIITAPFFIIAFHVSSSSCPLVKVYIVHNMLLVLHICQGIPRTISRCWGPNITTMRQQRTGLLP